MNNRFSIQNFNLKSHITLFTKTLDWSIILTKMYGKVALLLSLAIFNFGNALSLKKATESAMPSFCIFGICISDKKQYDKSNDLHDNRDKTIEELSKKQDELDQWKKEEEERKKLEEDEIKAKQQDAKDSLIAQNCQCTWSCGDRNDGTVCFRKCCNNEFGGNPNGGGVPSGGTYSSPWSPPAPAYSPPASSPVAYAPVPPSPAPALGGWGAAPGFGWPTASYTPVTYPVAPAPFYNPWGAYAPAAAAKPAAKPR